MNVGLEQFWQLAIESGLYSTADVRRLSAAYRQTAGATEGKNALRELVRWLLGKRVLTRYQAELLLAGQAGPFRYGDYRVLDVRREGPLAGLFAATHAESRHRVLLRFLSAEEIADNSSQVEAATQRMAEITRAAPALWRVYQWSEHNGYQFIVLEDVAGTALSDRLKNGPPLKRTAALRVALRVTEALGVLHRCQIGHGAVGTDSVWLDAAGEAKLIGFPITMAPGRSAAAADTQAADLAGLVDLIQALLLSDASADELSLGGAALAKVEIEELQSVLARLQTEKAIGPGLQRLAEHLRTLFDSPDDSASVSRRTAAAVAYESALDRSIAAESPQLTVTSVVDSLTDDAPVVVQTIDRQSISARRRPQPRRRLVGVAGAVVGVAVLAGAAVWFGMSGGAGSNSEATASQRQAEPVATLSARPSAVAGSSATGDDSARRPHEPLRAVSDQLWVSPTDGSPIDLAFLPSGAQALIAVQPAALLEAAGAPLLDARVSGALSSWLGEALTARTGIATGQIDQAILAFVDSAAAEPISVVVVRTSKPIDSAALEAVWGRPQQDADRGDLLYTRNNEICWLPKSGEGRLIVVGPESLMRDDVIPLNGDPPPLRRELEDLWPSTDAERHMTVVFAPRFLAAGGRSLLVGPGSASWAAAEWLLGGWGTRQDADGATPLSSDGSSLPSAALFSAHLDDDLYLEVRSVADPRRPVATQAEELRVRWSEAPRLLARSIASASISPYSADILSQFPRMVELVEVHTLAGVEGRQAVLCAYAPAAAAHNLALGGRLAALELSASRSGARPVARAPERQESAAERLRRPTSLVFDRAPLDRAVEMLAEDLGVPIVILGQDLEKEGITKNQSISRLEERDRPAADILRKIMIQANPDGKLVYVVRPADDGPGEVVAITTRNAVAERGEKLPDELAAP